jgi:hypothetical protein
MKKRHLLFLILMPGWFVSFEASAQTTGDYRSNAASFNWNVDASWQRWNGAAWVVPTGAQGFPGETAASIAGTVTIQNGHTVTANVDVTTNDIGNLILEGSGILNFNTNGIDIEATGNLTMDGTSQIQGTNSNRTLTVAGTLIVPATATNARVAGIRLTVGTAPLPPPAPVHIAATILGTITFNSNTGVKKFIGRVTVSGSWTSTAITTNNNLVFEGEVITSGTFACGCN